MHPVVPTTPTQYAFAIGILLLTPLLALFAASLRRARGQDIFTGVYVMGLISGASWVGAAWVLLELFPDYPHGDDLSEPMAMLFLLPGLIAGGATLHWFGRGPVIRKRSRASRLVLALAVVLAATLAVLGIVRHMDREIWRPRRLLPDGAEVIEEHIEEDGFLPDYNYSMRARMSEPSFHQWMRRLGVEPTDDPARYGDVGPHDISQQCRAHGHYEDGVGAFESMCW